MIIKSALMGFFLLGKEKIAWLSNNEINVTNCTDVCKCYFRVEDLGAK